MPNLWNERDLLRLTRDCELGQLGQTLHVVKTDGPYMTVRRSDEQVLHVGRDYAFATKIGEGAIDRHDAGPFSRIGDDLTDCETRLRAIEKRMRRLPTAKRHAIRVAETCDRLEKIAEDFAATDHAGTS